jgi:hypothetical protein
MIFIFGLDDGKVEETQTNSVQKCQRCGNVERWVAAKQVMRASLFFVPVLPVKKKYFYYCPICRDGQRISEKEYERLVNH